MCVGVCVGVGVCIWVCVSVKAITEIIHSFDKYGELLSVRKEEKAVSVLFINCTNGIKSVCVYVL